MDTGPKRSIEQLLGREKNIFFIRGAKVASRARGMRSIRSPEVSLGSPRVGSRRVQSPTPYTPPLPAPDISTKMHLKPMHRAEVAKLIDFRALWEPQAPAYAV